MLELSTGLEKGILLKSPLWFALPAVFVLSALFIGKISLLGTVAFATLFVISAIYVSSVGFLTAKGDYAEQLSWLADKVTKLNPEQQGVMFGKYPELSAFFQPRGRKAIIMVGPVDYRFFYEFMENSNHFQTWAQREIEGTQYESRDSRRRKWTLLTGYLGSSTRNEKTVSICPQYVAT